MRLVRIGLFLVFSTNAAGLWAADFSAEFLKAARDRGYGRVMVDYLSSLNASGKLPSEMKETFDIEMSRALRLAAKNDAFNREEREKWNTEANQLLEKFVKEHKDHPAVATAQSTYGDLAMEEAMTQLRLSRSTQDQDAKAKYLAEAGKAFQKAAPRFEDAASRFKDQFEAKKDAYDALAAQTGTPQAKVRKAEFAAEEALFDWLDSRFKLGQADFYFAQTIDDVKNEERSKALERAAELFDAIYQDNRESLVGLTAHAWHGRTADEQGKLELASDIYEEVLANAPNPDEITPKRETGLEGMFCQVFYFKALLEIKKGHKDEFVKTAPGFLKGYKAWSRFDGYQGIELEYVKALKDGLGKASGEDKKKMLREMMVILNDMKKTPSEFQNDAILLSLDISKAAGTSLDDPAVAIALAEESVKAADWEAATENYKQALELAKKSDSTRNKKLVPEIEAALEQVRYRKAAVLYAEGKYEETIDICGKIARNEKSPTGPQAAALAVSACLTLYAQAPKEEKEKALDRLSKIAEYTIKTWPDKAESDDARIAMGQAKLVQGAYEDAIKVFEDVNPRSQRYGVGLFLAGQTHWRLFSGGEKNDPQKGPARADQAEAALIKSVEELRKQAAENPKDPPARLPEAELLLSEVYLERGNGAKALELITPHIAALIAAKPKEVDNTVLRTFLTGVRAYLATGDLQKAADTAMALAEFAPDQTHVNRILVGFMVMLQSQWKEANAKLIEARTNNDMASRDEATKQLKAASDVTAKLIEKLLTRKELDVNAQLFMARTAMDIDRSDLGEPLYKALLEKADAGDPSVDKRIVPNCRAQLLAIVRKKGDYAEASKQVDKLLEEFPNALPYMMEKGRILQAWAEKDESKFDAAVQQWVDVRGKLQRLQRKPDEYYEVNYNAALCLYIESQKKNDPKKAVDAAKLLNALLFMTPKLSGPDMVAQYMDLLKKVDPEGYKRRVEAEKAKAKALKEKAGK